MATPGTPSRLFLTMNGQRHYLWRAVDQDDNVLDILVQSRRNKHAAKKFLRKAAFVIPIPATSETTTPTAKAAQARSFVIGSLRSRVEEQGRNEVEAKCGNDKDRCDNEPSLDKPVW